MTSIQALLAYVKDHRTYFSLEEYVSHVFDHLFAFNLVHIVRLHYSLVMRIVLQSNASRLKVIPRRQSLATMQ